MSKVHLSETDFDDVMEKLPLRLRNQVLEQMREEPVPKLRKEPPTYTEYDPDAVAKLSATLSARMEAVTLAAAGRYHAEVARLGAVSGSAAEAAPEPPERPQERLRMGVPVALAVVGLVLWACYLFATDLWILAVPTLWAVLILVTVSRTSRAQYRAMKKGHDSNLTP